MEYGVQYVMMMTGTLMMLELCVDNLDIIYMVGYEQAIYSYVSYICVYILLLCHLS